MAGTLIMRFLCPAAHCLPSSMYFLRPLRDGHVAVRVFQQRVELEADVAVVAAGLLPDRQEDLLGRLTSLSVMRPGDGLVVVPGLHEAAAMSPSNRPVLIRSEMMIGLDVAPVAPSGAVAWRPRRGRRSRARAWCRRRRGIAAGSWPGSPGEWAGTEYPET